MAALELPGPATVLQILGDASYIVEAYFQTSRLAQLASEADSTRNSILMPSKASPRTVSRSPNYRVGPRALFDAQ